MTTPQANRTRRALGCLEKRRGYRLHERFETDVVVLEAQTEPISGDLSERQQGWVVALGEEQHLRVVPEVHVAEFGMSIDPQASDDKGLEVTNEEVGQVEGAEFGLVPGVEHRRPGEELVAVRAWQANGVGSFEGLVEKTSGATVRVANEDPIELVPTLVDHASYRRGNELGPVVEWSGEKHGVERRTVGGELIEDNTHLAHERSAGDDEGSGRGSVHSIDGHERAAVTVVSLACSCVLGEVVGMRITGVSVRRYRYPLDPPFRAAWDPIPRVQQDAEIVCVHTDEGITGYASGDFLPDAAVLERFLVGLDPMRTEAVRQVCETVDFHRSRPWVVECAVWDVVGKALGQPVWKLLGGRNESLKAYASSGELMTAEERIRRVLALQAKGIGAVKIRFHHGDWRDDLAVLAQVRDAVGPRFELMVDANQGWRMEGDRSPRWDVPTAIQCARELEKIGVYWLEEPLDTWNVDGWAALRSRTDLRLAGGEMVRNLAEARDLVLRGGIDVLQPDVVLTGGIGGCRRITAFAELSGRSWSPHTWSNGFGMVVNLHAALGLSNVPYVEVPFDDPSWLPERRDWLLPSPVHIADDGTVRPPEGPGFGVEPDFDALERYRVA